MGKQQQTKQKINYLIKQFERLHLPDLHMNTASRSPSREQSSGDLLSWTQYVTETHV